MSRIGIRPPKGAPKVGSLWQDSKGLVKVTNLSPSLGGGHRLEGWNVFYSFVYPTRTSRLIHNCTLDMFWDTVHEPDEEILCLYQLASID